MDIGVFKRVLNSGELECFEFLVGIRQVNSWAELGELLIDVFNTDVDMSLGEAYINSVGYGDFLRVYNSILIKYLSYDPSVVYSFGLPYDKTFKMVLVGCEDFIVEFKKSLDELVGGVSFSRSMTNNISNCIITDIDRGIGLLDFGIRFFNTMEIFIKYIYVDLDLLKLRSFRYNGKTHDHGITVSFRSTWDEYMAGYKYNQEQKGKSRTTNFGLVEVKSNDELPF